LPIAEKWDLGGFVKFNYASVTSNNTATQGIGPGTITSVNHVTYRFSELSLGINAALKLPNGLSAYIGPDLGVIIGSKAMAKGTITSSGTTTPYGGDQFSTVTVKKNLQLGLNLGLMKVVSCHHRLVAPYLNIHFPLTNEIAFDEVKNKLYELNAGLCVMLK
jgi:hypothetical protein